VDDGGLLPDPDGLELAGLTLLLQRLARDHHELIDGLARSIGGALPDAVSVKRHGLLNTGRAHTLEIHLGDEVFVLRDQRGQIAAQVGRAVGGVVISHEPCAIDDWLVRLRAALEAWAQRSSDVAAALGRLS
jgi:hypothetical protein